MKIVMVTNTFTPHVGGVAKSVAAFAVAYRALGHRVLVIAPEFEGASTDEPDVVRVPAIQKFNGSDFSVRLPVPGLLTNALHEFQPDIVHAHHPFLLGGTALRIAAGWNTPLVFTHHTMYEQYTHYVPGDSPAMRRFVIDLATQYANLCDQVFAPSESVAALLRERGVEAAIEVVPTGIDIDRFAKGDGARFRREHGIPPSAFVVGHVGRLAPEKNLDFLARSVVRFLKRHPSTHFLVAGTGPEEECVRRRFARMATRLHMVGTLQEQDLLDAYHAMDVFAFASQSETQGMVLAEAMAVGVPVVAVDAPGVREVVRDRQNGRLLPVQDRRQFADALEWLRRSSPAERYSLRQEALRSAERFSMAGCAERALATYEKLIGVEMHPKTLEDSTWESTLRRLEAEWQLWSTQVRAAGTVFQEEVQPARLPVLRHVIDFWRRLRRWLSRREWTVRLLGTVRPESAGRPRRSGQPGLVLIQIDGFAKTQLDKALHRRRLPFLRRLMQREGYRLHRFYSGLPATTPAVQGEMFYGIKSSVPAFSFRDHRTGEVVRMFWPEAAARVQRDPAAASTGLLEGGSVYANIFSGGAAECHFCAVGMGWGDLLDIHPLKQVALLALNFGRVLRMVALMVLELFLAVADAIRGRFAGWALWHELPFVPRRLGVSILLRELVTLGAEIDVTRGLPIVHVNFLGYDEQAHHRGPGSAFGHWALKGIDRSIRRIWNAAHRSRRRDYEIWIYSDHGHEETIPYSVLTGRTIEEAVGAVFSRSGVRNQESGVRSQESYHEHTLNRAPRAGKHEQRVGLQYERLLWLRRHGWPGYNGQRRTATRADTPVVTALGPLGFIYSPRELLPEERDELAARLVGEAHIPLVFTVDHYGSVWARNRHGRFRLPEEADKVLSPTHPFLREVSQDLIDVCKHPDAGDFTFSGWSASGQLISFVTEYGAHGGPGPEEVSAFALVPRDAPLPRTDRDYLRPLDMRKAVMRFLHRSVPAVAAAPPAATAQRTSLRVMTYNVHSCVGLDGRLSPARIARVIAQGEPDIVALQEVDVGRARSGHIDQAHEIARQLTMHFHFHAALEVEEERYGNAVLSRFPLRLIQAGRLPRIPGLRAETRGAIWVAIEVSGREIQLINTHLGLNRMERLRQVQALLGPDWLGDPKCSEAVIFCGDLNTGPASRAYRLLCGRFRDAQVGGNGCRPHKTFFSPYPLTRIDHVFVGKQLSVAKVEVLRSELARVASDHLPLVVEVMPAVLATAAAKLSQCSPFSSFTSFTSQSVGPPQGDRGRIELNA